MGSKYVEPEYKDPGYEAAKQRSLNKNTGAYDAAISDTMNKSAQAGAVQGVANSGGLQAATYARLVSDKARRASAIEDMYNNYELQDKAAFNRQNAFAKAQFEMNKPGFLDYLGFAANLGSAGFGIYSALSNSIGAVSGLNKNKSNNAAINRFAVPPELPAPSVQPDAPDSDNPSGQGRALSFPNKINTQLIQPKQARAWNYNWKGWNKW